MDVHTNTTEPGGAATAKDVRWEVVEAIDEAKTALHLSIAATLLYRHLVLDHVKNGVATISIDNAEMLHSIIDLSWGRSSDVLETLFEISEAAR